MAKDSCWLVGNVCLYILSAATFLRSFRTQKKTQTNCELKIWHTNKLWRKREGLSPVLSPTFAFSGSEVFTINVRLLSVNTSINTAQCFTSYASFWLSHLFKESSRERKGDRGRDRERGGGGKRREASQSTVFFSSEAIHRIQCKATLASADEVPAIIARTWSN